MRWLPRWRLGRDVFAVPGEITSVVSPLSPLDAVLRSFQTTMG
jgi:hypothetical protein